MEGTSCAQEKVPKAFVWRRLHSIAGIWLSGYIIIHLLTNSQAALFVGDDGKGFIHAVNGIQDLPYLPMIEIAILGIPILIHLIWGIIYALKTNNNSHDQGADKPYLPYSRNKAYTWQRWTAWILAVGLIAHIVHMRFWDHPTHAKIDSQNFHMIEVSLDPGIYTLAERLNVKLYTADKIEEKAQEAGQLALADPETPQARVANQKAQQEAGFVKDLESYRLSEDQAVAVADNFGTAELLMLRETFKSPTMMILYTIFVLTAAFHAFNGLWTFLITWGVTPVSAQKTSLKVAKALMVIVAFMGLSAIWMTYWISLKS